MDAGIQISPPEKEEELYYGEVRIIEKTPKASAISVQDRKQQETIYSEVKVSTPENSSTQAANSPEENL